MPFPNEHSARLLNPNVEHVRVRRTRGSGEGTVQGVKIPTSISVIWFVVKEDGKEVPKAQALRFPKSRWTEQEARDWLKENKIKSILFEPASDEQNLGIDYVNQSDTQLDIVLHRDIGFSEETSSEKFTELLTPDITHINVDINSRGGTIMDGLSIYEQLRSHPANVHVKVSGVAASIASVIAMSGDTIEMPKTSMLMMHKPLIPVMVGANADNLRSEAEALDVMERSIILAYQDRMDKSESEIADMLSAGKWLNADKAIELGLADKKTDEEVDVLTYHDFSNFKDVPENVMLNFSLDANQDIPEIEKEEISFVAKMKKYFNIPNFEEDDMSSEKVEKLTTQLAEANAKIDKLTEKVTTLEEENKTLKDTQENAEKAKAEAANKTFLAEMIKEGRARPVDEQMHLDNMAGKDEEGLEAYKNWLKEFPTVVDVTGEEVATKETAVEMKLVNDEDELTKEANKVMAEKGCNHLEALDIIRQTKPELCN